MEAKNRAMRTVLTAFLLPVFAMSGCKAREEVVSQPEVQHADVVVAAEFREGVAANSAALESFPVGDATSAENYYKDIAKANILGFPNEMPPANLAEVITYGGYQGLTIEDIERLESSVLHDAAVLRTKVSDQAAFDQAFSTSPIVPGDILSVRFFSPKITDVSGRQFPTGEFERPRLGWRKVVRLLPRRGSAAQQHSVTAIHLLFNFFADPAAADPFKGHSVNNQAIFVQQSGKAFFMVFGPLNETSTSGQRITFLTASFDARDPTIDHGVAQYHVPRACEQCHSRVVRLNFLDTDHWYDRVQNGDDFAALRSNSVGVLADGGKIIADGGAQASTPEFAKAFEAVRTLNQEVLAQNRLAGTGSLQARAAEKWVNLHAADSGYIPPLRRGLPGTPPWDDSRELDRQLLPLLNRYCYRCHGSIGYNVFDRVQVRGRADLMADRIEVPSPIAGMPLDRDLPPADISRVVCLLRHLNAEVTGVVTPPNCP